MLDPLNVFYLALVGVGVVYAVVILISGGLHDLAGSIHIPHIGGLHDASFDHADVRVPSLSPVTIASFIVAFGAFGIVATQGFNQSGGASVVWAVLGGFVVAILSHFAFFYLLIAPQGSSEVTTHDIVGATAEVITPIPSSGLGEVAFVAQGGRITYPARSQDGSPISRGAAVTITSLVGSVVTVQAKQ